MTYEPGTVALVKFAWGMGEFRTCIRAQRHGKLGWLHDRLDGFTPDDHPAGPTSVRPLVVIDLSSAESTPESILRLAAKVLDDGRSGYEAEASHLRDWANQIEAQTRPPKPAEPTGLGAVIEDTEGRKYVRTEWQSPWDRGGGAFTYDAIDVARVLSEGVQP